jgi:hypothetical protein
MDLSQVIVRPALAPEEARFQQLMAHHNYLGALPKIGHTIWYVAIVDAQWVALLCFSAAALQCGARDRWIGWGFRHQFDCLNLIANNSRFLILPHCHHQNLASRVLSLCRRRLQADWQARFGFPVLMLETQWQNYYRRCPADPARTGHLTGRAAPRPLPFHRRGQSEKSPPRHRPAFRGTHTPTGSQHPGWPRPWPHRDPQYLGHQHLERLSGLPTCRPGVQGGTPDRRQKTGRQRCEVAYGITSKTAALASPEQILRDNRQHWCIENSCHYRLDWNYDEDRSRIRKGHGPEHMTRLRRFAIGVIKSKKDVKGVSQKMRQLMLDTRMVFDYFKMTDNCRRHSAP